jgi:hypothetical protein
MSTTCAICWLKSVLHEEKRQTGSDSVRTNATKTVSDIFRHQSKTGKSYCRTRSDVGSERVKFNVQTTKFTHTVCGCKCKVDKQKYSPKLHTLHLYRQPFWIYWSAYEPVLFSCNFYIFKIKYVQKIVKHCQLGTNLWKLYKCFVLFYAAADCSLRKGNC